MGITVGHAPDARFTGTAALLAGYGQYKRYQDEMNQRWNMQQAQIAAEQQRQAAQIAAAQQQQQAQIAAQTARDQFLGNQSADENEAEFERRMQLGDAQFQNSQAAADAELERAEKQEQFKYTARQKYDMEQLQNTLQNIDKRDDLSADEKAYAKKAVQDKMMGIKPMPMFQNDEPDINAQWDKRVKYDPENGMVGVMQNDGTIDFRPLPQRREPDESKGQLTPKDLAELRLKFMHNHREEILGPGGAVTGKYRYPTDEEWQAFKSEFTGEPGAVENRASGEPGAVESGAFNPEPSTWSGAMKAAGMAAEHAAMKQGIRDPLVLQQARNEAAKGVIDEVQRIAAQDTAFQGIPPEHRVQVVMQMKSAMAAVQQAQTLGEQQAAKQQLEQIVALIEQHQPAAVQPQGPPTMIAPPAMEVSNGR